MPLNPKSLLKSLLSYTFVAPCLAVPSAAQAEIIYCAVTNHGPYFAIADKIIFDVDAEQERVLVADGVLAHYGQVPAAGTLSRYNSKQIIASWTLRAVSATDYHDGLSYDLKYKARLNRKTMRMSISAWVDPINTIQGTGVCEVADAERLGTSNPSDKVINRDAPKRGVCGGAVNPSDLSDCE
ncbi:hypothetical protein [uncultured Shimia sp.]|uniref:hypothetical protein n=1 Tax=uncultured Shimia sp. TaxID=573152 RepID=UPI002607C54C|nr:hypothetical protein [uncultured Shimia sp.]